MNWLGALAAADDDSFDAAGASVVTGPGPTRRGRPDGARRSIGVPPRHFFTTSSVKSKCVEFSRISRFEELANSTISEILRDTVAADPASAIFLTREDAGTVSLTSVKVDLSEIRFVVTRRDGE